MTDSVLRIHFLGCERSSEAAGDQVTMHLNGHQVWPAVGERDYLMASGQDIGLGRDFLFGGSAYAVITLYDLDFISADDNLGSITIPATEAGTGPHTRDILGPGSHYKLNYRVGKIQF